MIFFSLFLTLQIPDETWPTALIPQPGLLREISALTLGVVMVCAVGQQVCPKAQSGLQRGKRFPASALQPGR